MALLIFLWAIIWGSLSAQLLVQTVTSLIISAINLAGLAFSKVAKSDNTIAFAVSVVQILLFATPRLSTWRPYFMEASMVVPRNERVAFARKCKADDAPK